MKKKNRIEVDELKHRITVGGRRVHLARNEYEVLLALRKSEGVLSRDVLMKSIWGGIVYSSRLVDQQVARIRRKVKVPVIETVSGYGYLYIG